VKILSVMKSTGLCLAIAFAGQANAGLIGTFSGTLGSISGWNSTANGNLAADIGRCQPQMDSHFKDKLFFT